MKSNFPIQLETISDPVATPSIYIRKLRFEEAQRKFLQELDSFFFKGVEEVEVIHGIGEHILRKMVENEVDKLDYVEIVSLPLSNPGALKLKLLVPPKHERDKFIL